MQSLGEKSGARDAEVVLAEGRGGFAERSWTRLSSLLYEGTYEGVHAQRGRSKLSCCLQPLSDSQGRHTEREGGKSPIRRGTAGKCADGHFLRLLQQTSEAAADQDRQVTCIVGPSPCFFLTDTCRKERKWAPLPKKNMSRRKHLSGFAYSK